MRRGFSFVLNKHSQDLHLLGKFLGYIIVTSGPEVKVHLILCPKCSHHQSCNDCILIYWDNHPYFWKGSGVFSLNPRRSVRRRNIVKSVLIELTGEFHSVVEALHYLLCLMYTVLNNVSVRSIGMCAS